MRLRNKALFIVLSVTLIVLATLSPWGTRLMLSLASNSQDSLSIEYKQGSLAGELIISSLIYSDQSTELNIGNLKVNIGWNCLFTLSVCVERLAADNVTVKLMASESQTQPTATPSPVSSPLPLLLEQFDIDTIDLQLADNTQVRVESTNSSLAFYKTLEIRQFSINKIGIKLPSSDRQESPEFDWRSISDWQYVPPQLPPLRIPIKLDAPSLNINSLNVSENDKEVLQVNTIFANLVTDYDQLSIVQFSLNHAAMALKLSAALDQNYRLESKMSLQVTDPAIPLTRVNLSATGSPDALVLSLRSEGEMTLNADVNANLMTAELPLDVALDWTGLNWPITAPDISSNKGQLRLQGDLNAYHLTSAVSLAGKSIPEAQISLSAKGNHQVLQLDKLSLETLDGNLINTGALSISDRLSWQGQTQLNTLNPGVFWPDYQADLNGSIVVEAEWLEKDVVIQAQQFDLHGFWRHYQLLAKGSGRYSSENGVNIPEVIISLGDNHASISAEVSTQQILAVNAKLDASNLSQIHPELAGQSNAEISLAGTISEPDLDIQAVAENVSFQTFSFHQATIEGALDWRQQKDIQLKVDVEKVSVNKQAIDSLQLSLLGPLDSHDLTIGLAMDSMTFDSAFSGALNETRWSGKWRSGKLASGAGDFVLDEQGADILADWATNLYQLSPHCWRQVDQKLCIAEAQLAQDNLRAQLTGDSLKIVDIVNQLNLTSQAVSSDSRLNFSASTEWNLQGLPGAELVGTFSPAEWQFGQHSQKTKINEISVSAQLSQQRLTSELRLSGQDIGKAQVEVALNNIDTTRDLEGVISVVDLDLSPAVYMTTELTDLTGLLSAEVNLHGSLQQPRVTGNIAIKDGSMAGPLLPVSINQLEQEIQLTGQGARIAGSFLLGEGPGKLTGDLSWQDEVSGNLVISGQNMEFDYQNVLRARFSPELDLQFSPRNVSVKGKVSVPYARVKVRELPPSALSPSNDVVLINQAEEERQSKTQLELDVQVVIDEARQKEVKLDAFGLTSGLQGDLQLTNNGDVMIGNGELRLVDGRYRAYGQDLLIRRGEVIFSGPMDNPLLDIEAIRDPEKTANDVIAGIRVEGIATEPDISVFSNPEKSQSEALSYLLRGQCLGCSEETSGDALLANALIGFGLSKSENKITRAGNKLGIDDLALSTTGQGEDTKVAVSGYVAPGVQLRYGVGVFDSASEVALRYQIIPKLYLEAVSGLNNALDVYYQFSVGEQETAEKPSSDNGAQH